MKKYLFYFYIGWAVPLFAQPLSFEPNEVFLALSKAYPDAVKIVPNRMNKRPWPALLVRGKLFYWVYGRILPVEALDDWERFAPEDFYLYPKEPRDPAAHSPAWLNYLETTTELIYKKTPRPYSHPEIWDTIYEVSTRKEAESRMKTGRFFKRLIVVHKDIWGPLKQVEADLSEMAKSDPELDHFLKVRMNAVYTFYWRTIAKTPKRSTHSYGTSIDTADSKNKRKATYWLWRRVDRIPWAREPLSARWSPPKKFIETFEKYGFAWGGKWNFYDTIHFEYRPDILLLNGYDVTFLSPSQ